MHKKQKYHINQIIGGLVTVAVLIALLPVSTRSSAATMPAPDSTMTQDLGSTTVQPPMAAASLSSQGTSIPSTQSGTPTPGQGLADATGPPQYKYQALDDSETTPLYESEHFLNRISATGAWGAYSSSSGTAPVVAVIDTGFELNSQYLAGRLDGTPGTSSWKGWDFVDNDDNPVAGRTDPNGADVFHGTMTAGLVGLLDPAAKIMPLQALSDDGTGYTSTVAAAVDYAANNGATIISMSLGSSSDDPTLHAAIDYAISKGVLVVAAAGNGGCNCMDYPGDYPEVLSVGATDASDNLASFSSYGANLDVVAPGTAADVCSSFYSASGATNEFSCGYSGTSFATPLVSGLAAMMLQANPGLSPTSLIADIEQGADQVAGMDGQSHTLEYGYGRIDVARSMALAEASTTAIDSGTMNTICVGFPGATCDITLVGPQGQRVDLGSQTTDLFGGAYYTWNIDSLGLVAGPWQVDTTLSASGDTITLPPTEATMSP